jgi:hypothetical protein
LSSGWRGICSRGGVDGGVRGNESSGTSVSLTGWMSGVDGMAGEGTEEDVKVDELDSREYHSGGVAGALGECKGA